MNASLLHGILVGVGVAIVQALITFVPAISAALGPVGPFVAPALAAGLAALLHLLQPTTPPPAA